MTFFLQIQIDSADFKKLVSTVAEPYWQHSEFWINVVLGIVGIWIGWLAFSEAGKAFNEAGKAKDAATAAEEAAIKAGKTVKKQSILLAISDTIRICQIRIDTNYEDTNNKLMDINGKVRNILGLYKEDIGQDHQSLLQQIITCSSDVLTEFNLLDPDAVPKDIYNRIRPLIIPLVGHLNELLGVLENELIANN